MPFNAELADQHRGVPAHDAERGRAPAVGTRTCCGRGRKQTAISYQDLTGPATPHTIPSGGAFGVDDLRAAADGSGAPESRVDHRAA